MGVWGPFRGSIKTIESAHVAQMAERVLGKDEVSGSIPDMGSIGLRAGGTRRGWGPAVRGKRIHRRGQEPRTVNGR